MTARLLDISRLVSRMGNGPLTGIDRVELAYLQEFLKSPETAFFLCRLPRSYAVLDARGGAKILNDIKDVIYRTSCVNRQKYGAKLKLRRARMAVKIAHLSVSTCKESSLHRCFEKVFTNGVTYFNVGHSNLREIVFTSLRSLPRSKIIVFIHDVIPVSYPEYSRPEVTTRFGADLKRVALNTDIVIYNSQATREAAEAVFLNHGRVPRACVAHLASDNNLLQRFDNATEKPSFVMIGTIEPRKNHAMLLDIWQSMAQELPDVQMPDLHIIGRRGWNNDNIFNRLDALIKAETHIFEHNDLSDAEAGAMLSQSWALLFPSFVEGFGLPLIEASRFGVPIICGENDVYREILGDYPLYLNVDNSYLWKQGILERAGRQRESEVERQVRSKFVKLTDWNGHFDQIFRFI